MSTSALLERRAAILASVLLTRHPHVTVQESVGDFGLDLNVQIAKNAKPSGRMFGVVLKAVLARPRLGRIIAPGQMKLGLFAKRAFENALAQSSDLPFPLAIMFFTMDEDRCFWQWLKEPSFKVGKATLAWRKLELAEEWGPSTTDEIVASVSRWYEARAS